MINGYKYMIANEGVDTAQRYPFYGKVSALVKPIQWHRKMISSGVAKKTMRAEIAVSSEQHNSKFGATPATPVPMPLLYAMHWPWEQLPMVHVVFPAAI